MDVMGGDPSWLLVRSVRHSREMRDTGARPGVASKRVIGRVMAGPFRL
jgi:hypothetical protein